MLLHAARFVLLLLEVIVLFNLLIAVHELGHFLAAKWRGLYIEQFGIWFGVEFDAPFVAGTHATGRIVPTRVDAEVARMQEPYTGTAFDIHVDRIEPMQRFSFHWHPFAIDAGVDYSKEPATEVGFELEAADGGTLLTITESGFERLPAARRAGAFAANERGWQEQVKLIGKFLALA